MALKEKVCEPLDLISSWILLIRPARCFYKYVQNQKTERQLQYYNDIYFLT